MVDTVTRELLRGRGAENEVALEARVDDLHNYLLVGEADDQAVLGRVVLVLGLGHETLAGVVVGLAGPAARVLDLEAAANC